jgi:hypothetical protein
VLARDLEHDFEGLSLMPEGLEIGQSPQAFADLLAILQQPR